jgi:broad specificity phosphatase PhoE
VIGRAIGIATLLGASAFASVSAQKEQKHRDKHKLAASYPAHVLIIRHGEKPPDASASESLSPTGVARAKALSQLFTKSTTRPDPLPKPDFIFATRVSKHSQRPIETASPLGTALHITVDTEYGDNGVEKLAEELFNDPKYEGKTILIVWHQGMIPKLARALGAKDAPHGWKESVFDRVWEITYADDGEVEFQDRPQHLLPGDSVR